MSAEPCERVQISGRVVNCSCIFNLDSSRISNAENQMLSKVEVLFYVVEVFSDVREVRRLLKT